jgi:hypothetical protein
LKQIFDEEVDLGAWHSVLEGIKPEQPLSEEDISMLDT